MLAVLVFLFGPVLGPSIIRPPTSMAIPPKSIFAPVARNPPAEVAALVAAVVERSDVVPAAPALVTTAAPIPRIPILMPRAAKTAGTVAALAPRTARPAPRTCIRTG